MFNWKRYDWKRFDGVLLLAVLLLCSIGAFCIEKTDGASMFRHQVAGILLGLAVVVFLVVLDYHFICKFVILYYMVAVGMLAAVRFTGLGVNHDTIAYRWLNVGITEIQPSELVKIIMILVMAAFLTKVQKKLDKWYVFLLSGVLMGIPTLFIMMQPDLSSSLVMMFIYVVMMFMAGLSMKIIIPIVAAGIPSAIVLFWYIQQPFQKLLSVTQRNRIISFLNPDQHAGTGMYQQNMARQSIASGELYGKLLMNDASDYRRYSTLPVNESDFIFSVIGEEFGFLGGCVVILLFAIVILRCIRAARKAADYNGQMICYGVSAMLMFQVFANIGVATSLLPNTGLPLPFLSFGVSSLLSSMIAVGLVLNVGLQKTNSRG